VRHSFAGWKRRVDVHVQRDQRSVLLLRRGHHGGEVEHEPAQPVELRNDQRVGITSLQDFQRGLNSRPLESLPLAA